MKRIVSLILAGVMSLVLIAGCAAENKEEVNIRIAGLKGPTSMGLVQLMDLSADGKSENKYTFTISGTPDEVTPKLISGELDMAALPANLASVLYNNTDGAVQIIAVNTLGVFYLTELGDTVKSFADLKGQTIYASGKGSSPEYVLRYLLMENGLDPDKDVTIEWKSEHTEVVALLAEKGSGIAMLPQPFVFVAKASLPDLRVALDLNQAWEDLDNGSLMITGVLVVRTEFAKENPEEVEAFLKEYKTSTEFVNANPKDASLLIEEFDIFNAAVAEKAIPFCNITYVDGSEMKTAMEGYLNVLFEQNSKSIGGKLPDADFYYSK